MKVKRTIEKNNDKQLCSKAYCPKCKQRVFLNTDYNKCSICNAILEWKEEYSYILTNNSRKMHGLPLKRR